MILTFFVLFCIVIIGSTIAERDLSHLSRILSWETVNLRKRIQQGQSFFRGVRTFTLKNMAIKLTYGYKLEFVWKLQKGMNFLSFLYGCLLMEINESLYQKLQEL